VVLGCTVGVTHFVRPEDWPIMPMTKAGFTLQPVGFFDRNPTLYIPPPPRACCHSGEGLHSAEQASPPSLPLGGRTGAS
jgi:primary-amine oxidase